MALALPLLLLLVFGIMDFALMFQQYLVINNAAEEGARVGVLPGYSATDAQARAQEWIDKTFLSTGASPTITATPGTIGSGGNCFTTMTVAITVPPSFLTPIPLWVVGLQALQLNASSTMRTEITGPAC
jgi:Flp pilus assembly protein TadG